MGWFCGWVSRLVLWVGRWVGFVGGKVGWFCGWVGGLVLWVGK